MPTTRRFIPSIECEICRKHPPSPPTPNRHATTGCRRAPSPSVGGWIPRAPGFHAPPPPPRQNLNCTCTSLHRQKLVYASTFTSSPPLPWPRHAASHLGLEEASMATTRRRPPWPHTCAPAGSLPTLHLNHCEEKQLHCSAIDLTVHGGRRRSGERGAHAHGLETVEDCVPIASTVVGCSTRSLRVARVLICSPWIPRRRGSGSVRRSIVAMEVEAEQAELHGSAHGDSRCGGCKPRFDCCELDSMHVLVDLVAGSSINGSRA
jgi:hypothetical protein